MQKVVTSNLNPLLKLFFYLPILTNNNLLLKIYCKNIVKILCQYFSIRIFYFLFYFSSFHFSFIQTHFFSFFSFFFFVFFSSIQVSSAPSFILFSTSRTFQQLICFTSERERERELLVHRPTAARPPPHHQAGSDWLVISFFLFFFLFLFFSQLLVLIQLYFKNWILFCVLCLDYVRNGENERKKNPKERERIDIIVAGIIF